MALAFLLLAALPSLAGVPQPAVTVYGLIRDAYGFPYDTGVEIVLSKHGVTVSRAAVTRLLPGSMNYRMTLAIDSGGVPYADYAVQQGDAIDIVVRAGGRVQPLIPTNRLVVPAPGSRLRLNLITGTDSCGDGLPDEWKWQLIEQSGGLLTALEDVRPGDDFDGDGMTNWEEFLAGTFAFLSTDVLALRNLEFVEATGRFKFRFMTSPNRTYRLFAGERLEQGRADWMPIRFAVKPRDAATYRTLVGDGMYHTLYIDADPDAASMFLYLGVE